MTISWLALIASAIFSLVALGAAHVAVVFVPFYLLLVCIGQARIGRHRRHS